MTGAVGLGMGGMAEVGLDLTGSLTKPGDRHFVYKGWWGGVRVLLP